MSLSFSNSGFGVVIVANHKKDTSHVTSWSIPNLKMHHFYITGASIHRYDTKHRAAAVSGLVRVTEVELLKI